MRVHDVMIPDPICCVPSDTAMRAACVMKDRNTGIVPIVENDRSRKLVGVVTDRDLCLAVVAEGQYPNSVQLQSCMATTLITCAADDPVQAALEQMRENQVRRIMVADHQGEIQGIVSLADIVRCSDATPTEIREALKCLSEPTDAPSKPRAAAGYRKSA
jgi:CBS domain-containing protein